MLDSVLSTCCGLYLYNAALQERFEVWVQPRIYFGARVRTQGNILLISKLGGFRSLSHRKIRGTAKHLVMVRSGNKWRCRPRGRNADDPIHRT